MSRLVVERVELRAIHDPDPDLSWLLGQGDINDPDPDRRRYARLDRIRLSRWHRGEWCYVALVVDAVLTVVNDVTRHKSTARHTSGPLRDVTSDARLVDVIDMWGELATDLTHELPADAFTPATAVVVVSTPKCPESAHTVRVVAR